MTTNTTTTARPDHDVTGQHPHRIGSCWGCGTVPGQACRRTGETVADTTPAPAPTYNDGIAR